MKSLTSCSFCYQWFSVVHIIITTTINQQWQATCFARLGVESRTLAWNERSQTTIPLDLAWYNNWHFNNKVRSFTMEPLSYYIVVLFTSDAVFRCSHYCWNSIYFKCIKNRSLCYWYFSDNITYMKLWMCSAAYKRSLSILYIR